MQASTFGIMVEVFKTNVTEQHHAKLLLDLIHKNFQGYKANFDLDDCDNILRVQCNAGAIQSLLLIDLLHNMGFNAEIVPE